MRLHIFGLVLECLFSISGLSVLLDIVCFVVRGEGRAGVNCFLLYQNLRGLPGRGWKFGTALGEKMRLAGAEANTLAKSQA